jgi:hypothetical protein
MPARCVLGSRRFAASKRRGFVGCAACDPSPLGAVVGSRSCARFLDSEIIYARGLLPHRLEFAQFRNAFFGSLESHVFQGFESLCDGV